MAVFSIFLGWSHYFFLHVALDVNSVLGVLRCVIVDDDADFLGLLPHFHPEDYGSMYLRNVETLGALPTTR
jgi:hypothetical protein